MENLTDLFVRYLFEKSDAIGEGVLKTAALAREDTLSVTEAGAVKNADKWAGFLAHVGAGKCPILGYGVETDMKTAALVNGFNAHSLELDDGQRFAMIHLGAAIVSALFAAKHEFAFSDEAELRGIVLGYEAACRLSIAMQPSHKKRGYHSTGTCGTVGAAVGAAFAIGLDKKQMKRVVTAAAASSAGMLEIQEQNSELKPYNPARAAMDGLCAACMGLAHFDTPDDMLGGERGFFAMFSDNASAEKLLAASDTFEIERRYVKPYASCRHSHSAVEAAIKLRGVIAPEKITSVTVETYSLGVKGHDHTAITGVASAKLSTPYAVAAALLYGRADLTVFEPIAEAASRLAKLVTVKEQADLTKECPEKRVAIVTVTADGRTFSARVDHAKGEPENPLTEAEFEEKQRSLREYIKRNRTDGMKV